MVFLAACSGDVEPASEAAVTTTTTIPEVTTTFPNRPPELRVAPIGRAEIGQRLTEPILGFDPDGDDVTVTVGEGPLGFSPTLNTRGRVTGFSWEPFEPGEWTIDVTGTDDDGAVTTVEVLLVARNPRTVDLLVAMGDSVAGGFGRDRSDFLGSDDCFRSEDSAYGLFAHLELIEVGALGEDSDALLVACAGADVTSLETDSVIATRASAEVVDGAARSQLQWAIDMNPTIVTLTVGASDLGLLNPERTEEFISSPDPTSDAEAFASFQEGLIDVLDVLTTSTDAHVAVTTYYDPTAAQPVGVEGCRASCFADTYGARIDELNTRIRTAVDATPDGRVSLVGLDGSNDVWEAGNATGPDQLRDGLGPLQGLVDRVTGGGGATCADDGGPVDDFVSGLDCLHPNADGHIEIGRAVVDVLTAI